MEAALKAELAAARAENELLLQQITRLCLFIEQRTGCDPIEVMYARNIPPPPAAAPSPAPAATSLGGWLRKLVTSEAVPASASSSASPPPPPPPPPPLHEEPPQSPQPAPANEAEPPPPLPPALTVDEAVAAGTRFRWDGDPEAIDALARRVLKTTIPPSEVVLGTGLTLLPSTPSIWQHLSRSLVSLCLNGNNLVELPAAFDRLQALRRLRLEGNLFRALPPSVLRLSQLEELGIGCNQLTGLPEGIENLARLVDLWLVQNEISYLPHAIGALSALRRLELSGNALHELPRSFAKLQSLRQLWLNGNSIATFPQQICALDNLEQLDLKDNQLTSLPRAVGTMPGLQALLLEGNPLVFPPIGVVSQGPGAPIEYIRNHRHSDVLSSESERSAQQIAAFRDRLNSSIGAQEERRRQMAPSRRSSARNSNRNTPAAWLEPVPGIDEEKGTGEGTSVDDNANKLVKGPPGMDDEPGADVQPPRAAARSPTNTDAADDAASRPAGATQPKPRERPPPLRPTRNASFFE